jgi:hypothetical protein
MAAPSRACRAIASKRPVALTPRRPCDGPACAGVHRPDSAVRPGAAEPWWQRALRSIELRTHRCRGCRSATYDAVWTEVRAEASSVTLPASCVRADGGLHGCDPWPRQVHHGATVVADQDEVFAAVSPYSGHRRSLPSVRRTGSRRPWGRVRCVRRRCRSRSATSVRDRA